AVVVRFDEAIDVDQDIGGRGLARQGMGGHKILSRAGGFSLSGRQIFYTMRRARFLAGCDRRARSFDLDRIEPGILNVDLKTGLAFDRGPKNLFDCIDIGEGESFRGSVGAEHSDGDPAAAAIGVDFDAARAQLERSGRERSLGRSRVDETVLAQAGEADAEAVFFLVVRVVLFARGMIEICVAVVIMPLSQDSAPSGISGVSDSRRQLLPSSLAARNTSILPRWVPCSSS